MTILILHHLKLVIDYFLIDKKMKKISILFLTIFFTLTSCKKPIVEKPKTLLDKEQMENIIYDITLLEAIRSQNFGSQKYYPSTTEFIKKKYKVDSFTFVQNTKYYASDIKEFKKIYERVREKVDEQIVLNDKSKSATPKAIK